jgi:hypothetical protein
MSMNVVEKHVEGGRLFGLFVKTDHGFAYVALRERREIFRGGAPTVGIAIEQDTAAWAIDNATLLLAQKKGATHIGVQCQDTGEKWFTPIGDYFSHRARFIDYSNRGGSKQRCLPLTAFQLYENKGSK